MKRFWKPHFEKNDLKVKTKKILYSGYLHLVHYNIKFRLFKGKWSNFINRDLILTNNCISVLLFDPCKKLILFTEQFRIGNINNNPWTLEIISGAINNNSGIIRTTIKEIKEETDSNYLDIIYLMQCQTSPGISSEKIHLFIGIFNAKKANKIFGLKKEGEDIKTHLYSLEQSLFFIKHGLIQHSPTIIAILWLKNYYYDIL